MEAEIHSLPGRQTPAELIDTLRGWLAAGKLRGIVLVSEIERSDGGTSYLVGITDMPAERALWMAEILAKKVGP